MKITSADNICWISLQAVGASGYRAIEMVTHVDIGHGRFDGRNGDLHFLNLEEFMHDLDEFITDRKRTPRLNGTYDTYLAFSQQGSSVMCEYCLGDAFSGRKTAHFQQSGRFEIDQERLLELTRGFRELLARYRG